MKTVLGLIASPRKLGNSEIFTKEIARNLENDWALKLIRLPRLNIRPCRACYSCLFDKEVCVQKDDIHFIIHSLLAADAYIIAAPTYFLGPNSSIKRVLDRALSLYAHIDKLWGKPSVAVAIAGIEGMEGYTKLGLESFAKLTFSDLKASAVVYGALPGETLLSEKNKKIANELAQCLLGQKKKVSGPTCPVCGGDTFRFFSDTEIRCMLCSSKGTIAFENGKTRFQTAAKKHDLFSSLEKAKSHAEWLRNMKNLFLEKRKELKQVCLEYAKDGKWLEPEKEE